LALDRHAQLVDPRCLGDEVAQVDRDMAIVDRTQRRRDVVSIETDKTVSDEPT
jgi:hypothetical protein